MVSMTHKHSNNSHKEDKKAKLGNSSIWSDDLDLIKVLGEPSETKMRVGKAYQAEVPKRLAAPDPRSQSYSERALLVWAPNAGLPDRKVEEYAALAKDKYGYSSEQALGMLFWHNHDMEKATKDLANFCPYREQWTIDDKVLFEQAFQFHGKHFHRIRQMLPEKTISQLVKYYYLWKKTCQKTSHIDKQARKQSSKTEGSESVASGAADVSDDEDDPMGKDEGKNCSNCTVAANQLNDTPKGSQCLTCFNHWKRLGTLRPTIAPKKRDRQLIKHKKKPPKGMYINHEDLLVMALTDEHTSPGKNEAGHKILEHMETELGALKKQVQSNKAQISSAHMALPADNINAFRPSNPVLRLNAKWSHDELLLAVQGVRQYGKDFQAIAEVVGNKTANHVKSFFVTYRKRYSLEALVKEWQQENVSPLDNDDVIMKDVKPFLASTSKTEANSS